MNKLFIRAMLLGRTFEATLDDEEALIKSRSISACRLLASFCATTPDLNQCPKIVLSHNK